MTKRNEIYRALQKKWVELVDLKVGDKVKVIIKFKSNEFGSTVNLGNFNENITLNSIQTVSSIGFSYISINNHQNACPFFCLEKVVEEPKLEITVKVNGKEVSPSTLSKKTWDNIRSKS